MTSALSLPGILPGLAASGGTPTPTPTPGPTQLTPPTITGNTAQTGNLGVTSGTYTTGTVITTLMRGGVPVSAPYTKTANDADATFWAQDKVTAAGDDYYFLSDPLTVANGSAPAPTVYDYSFSGMPNGRTLTQMTPAWTLIGTKDIVLQVESNQLCFTNDYDNEGGWTQTVGYADQEFRFSNLNNPAGNEQSRLRAFGLVYTDSSNLIDISIITSSSVSIQSFIGGVSQGNNYFSGIGGTSTSTYAVRKVGAFIFVYTDNVLVYTADLTGKLPPNSNKLALEYFSTSASNLSKPEPVASDITVKGLPAAIVLVSCTYDVDTSEVNYVTIGATGDTQLQVWDVSDATYPTLISDWATVPASGSISETMAAVLEYRFRDTDNAAYVVTSDAFPVPSVQTTNPGMNAGDFSGLNYWQQNLSAYADLMTYVEWKDQNNNVLANVGPGINPCFDKNGLLISWPISPTSEAITELRLLTLWSCVDDDTGDREWLNGGIFTRANYGSVWTLSNPGGAPVTVNTVTDGPHGGPILNIASAFNNKPWQIVINSLPGPMTANTLFLIGADTSLYMTQGWIDSKAIYNG